MFGLFLIDHIFCSQIHESSVSYPILFAFHRSFEHSSIAQRSNDSNKTMNYEQEMEYQPPPNKWSNTAKNASTTPINKMESTNYSDDGDYDVEDAEYGEEVNYPYEEQHHDNVSREGSDVSDAEKYADRNSDPGVHVAEQNYGLPYDMAQGGGGGNMHGMNANLYPGMNNGQVAMPSGAESVSLGTATQTHEVRMPMLLSTFVSDWWDSHEMNAM